MCNLLATTFGKLLPVAKSFVSKVTLSFDSGWSNPEIEIMVEVFFHADFLV